MYGLYDRDGILRFVNSDKEACLDYAKLFKLTLSNNCLIHFMETINKDYEINLDLNQVKNSN